MLSITSSGEWVMVSDVTFEADVSSVSVPASGVLLLGAFGALAARRRR